MAGGDLEPVLRPDTDAPEVVPTQQKEMYNQDGVPIYGPDTTYSTYAGSKSYPRSTVCGLRRTTFWLLAALASVVVLAAVVGGVVGSLAVKNAKQTAAADGPSGTADALSAAASGSSTATATKSSSASAAASSTPSVAECPGQNGTTITSAAGDKFEVYCLTDFAFNDLTTVALASLDDCVDACSTWNDKVARGDNPAPCAGAVLQFASSDDYPFEWYGGICYLKSNMSAPSYNAFISSAKLL